MSYQYTLTNSNAKKIRRHRRYIRFLLCIFFLIVVAVIIIIYIIFSSDKNTETPSTAGASSINNPYKTYKTNYFSFQADKTWHFIPKESTSNKFLYRSTKKGAALRDLTIFVNSGPNKRLATHVVSLSKKNNWLKQRKISEHCSKYTDYRPQVSRDPRNVVFDGVNVYCQVDGSTMVVTAGLSGSGTILLKRPNGQVISYDFIYRDLEFYNKPELFAAILDSFQTR